MVASVQRLRMPSPALQRAQMDATTLSERTTKRRLAWVWGLLFLNVLPYSQKSPVLHMPTSIGKVITQAALVAALLVALSINRRVLIRPNLFLLLLTLLSITTVMMSVQGYFGLGSVLRAGRLVLLVAVLWLLTPWWGRRDLLFLRLHRGAMYVVLAIVVLGLIVSPGAAFAQAGGHRLGGAIWPVPPTQVAEYAAVLTGTTVVMWFTDLIRPRTAAIVSAAGLGILLLTHTRTALVGLVLGVAVAALSLFVSRKRVRTALGVTVVVAGLVAVSFAPFLSSWLIRGETSHQLSTLTGRSQAWSLVVQQPRSPINTVFGFGMSNDSIEGLPIDSSWYSAYLDQGLVGDVIDGAVLLLLLLIAVMNPRGPRRAIALFLVVYCLVASITETGLGQASPYMLDLAVAMSLLVPRTVGAPPPGELQPSRS